MSLDYRPTTEFGALAGQILSDLERLRPGLPADAPEEEIRRRCEERLRLRLPELYREYQADTAEGESQAQLALYERELSQLLLPRYAALARQQNRAEAGGPAHDLYNRVSYAAIFFVIGVFIVWAPFIPLWDKWIPFVLAVIAPLLAPWLPDLYKALQQRRHGIALGVLQMDLDHAGRSLPLPPLPLPAPVKTQADAEAQRTPPPQVAEKH